MAIFRRDSQTVYPTIGTTPPILIARRQESDAIKVGADYFLVQIHSAQAAFKGSVWDNVKSLIVATQVNLNHSALGNEGVRAIQRTREVRRNRAEQLGLRSNLVDLVPCVMPHVTVSIEFILDKESRLAALGGLINSDSFLAAVSLAPGAAVAAKTVSGLAQKIIQTFIPGEEREPILQFSGDFNLATGDLQDGYYAILGTRDENNPLPNPLPTLALNGAELLANGERVTQFSYVVLDVRRTQARTRDLSDGAIWNAKLVQAEDEAKNTASDPLSTTAHREETWSKCKTLIREAQALLRADVNYLRSEADSIIKQVYSTCASPLTQLGPAMNETQQPMRRRRNQLAAIEIDTKEDRLFLDINPSESLNVDLHTYEEAVTRAKAQLVDVGRLPHSQR